MFQDMKEQLGNQLRLLENSTRSFDAGHKIEAIRIGTVLRVIFHQTKNTTSLLTHLNATTILVRSKAHPVTPGLLFGWSLARVSLGFRSPSEPEQSFGAIVEPEPSDRMIEALSWWNEAFAVMGGTEFTRRSVALWAADKEAVHVDKAIPDGYARLKMAGAFVTFFDSTGKIEGNRNAHYAFLRTMASEVLNSPELIELTQ